MEKAKIKEEELDFFENTQEPKPKHGQEGKEYRLFKSESIDRGGFDIYCSNCNHWNTVLNTNILFPVIGNCKNCGTEWNN